MLSYQPHEILCNLVQFPQPLRILKCTITVYNNYGSGENVSPILFIFLTLTQIISILQEKCDGEIKLNNVGFRYPTRRKVKVLRNLNIAVNPGQTVALVGTSGCGKSTSVSLVERFYDVGSGSVVRLIIILMQGSKCTVVQLVLNL